METTPNIRARQELERLEVVAGNGLLNRRAFLRGGAAFAATVTGYTVARSAAAEPLKDDPWSLGMGAVTPPLQTPSRFEKHVVRTLSNPNNELRNSHARTPHHLLNGTITPNSMHFSINHSGLPDIDPEKHRLVIHGLVRQPLVFTVESLSRYPMESRMAFVECSGNSAPMFSNQPVQATAQALHRSVPVKKALDDAMIGLYQNGERLMPGNGYPMRLLLPGYQGNMNVKFLRRLKVVDQPAMSMFESKTYSQLLPDGKAWRFHFLQEVKSFITHPSFGQ